MKEKKLKKCIEKCVKIKDMLLNQEIDNDDELQELVKKKFTTKEIEYLAMEYLVSLALTQQVTDQLKEQQQGDGCSCNQEEKQQTYNPKEMNDDDKIAYI